jgi:hypothetical protein
MKRVFCTSRTAAQALVSSLAAALRLGAETVYGARFAGHIWQNVGSDRTCAGSVSAIDAPAPTACPFE